jgi:hypothetical protein
MNRKKTKQEIKRLKEQLRAANRNSLSRLLKLAFVLAILALIAVFIQKPNSFEIISRIASYFNSAETTN